MYGYRWNRMKRIEGMEWSKGRYDSDLYKRQITFYTEMNFGTH